MDSELTYQSCLSDQDVFLGMLKSAVVFFGRHVEYVNELNVFPVPDGDTGTNMFGTLTGIYSKLQSSTDFDLEDTMKKASEAALLEGRGNSGIILSQIIRGLYEGFDFQRPIDIRNLSSALDNATERAYKAVGNPTEGTILTVLKDVTVTCNAIKHTETDICNAFGMLYESAVNSVDKTPNNLNILKEAGVVDSGGYGLEIILQGMELYLREVDPLDAKIKPRVPLDGGAGMKQIFENHEDFGFCTQFTLESSFDYEKVNETFKDLGTSTVIIGESGLYRVHIHTETPDDVVHKGTEIGVTSKISVENMENQASAMAQGSIAKSVVSNGDNDLTSLAGLVSGQGIAQLFTEMGTSVLWDPEGTLMPSVSEILDFVDELTAKDVIFLPNNKNAIPAAREAANLSQKNMMVLPTENLAQGLECVAEFQSNLDIDSNFQNMVELLPFVGLIEIFSASRSTSINGTKVSAGEMIAMRDGSVLGKDSNVIDLLVSSVLSIKKGPPVMITILTKAGSKSLEFSETVVKLTERLGVLDENGIQVYGGGQRHYDFIVSLLFE